MIPTAFEYHRAKSVDDALKAMAAAGGSGKFVAGGHSLVPLMKLRLSASSTDFARWYSNAVGITPHLISPG